MGFRGLWRGFLGDWNGVACGGDAAVVCIGLYRAESRFCGVLPGACRRADVPTCRRADVPTCRRADVPTCRRADVLQLQREPHPALYIECGAAFFLANHANPCCTLSRFAIDNYHALRSCGAGFGGDAPWNFSLNPV